MSITGGHLDALLAAGATAEQIVALVKADMEEREAKLTVRREKDAVRQRRKRSRGVTRTERDTFPNDRDILTPTSTPSNSNELDTPVELKPEHVVEVWNDLAVKHGLPSVKKVTPERLKKLNSFIRRWSIDDITEAIEAIPRSPFLLGQNDRGWQASFDWFLEPRNLTKLTEGVYVH